jgi:hypothetical protein
MTTAATAPQSAMLAPTERSIPQMMITIVMPMERMVNTEDALIILVMLIRLRKFLIVKEKTTTNPSAMQSNIPFLLNKNSEGFDVLSAMLFMLQSF